MAESERITSADPVAMSDNDKAATLFKYLEAINKKKEKVETDYRKYPTVILLRDIPTDNDNIYVSYKDEEFTPGDYILKVHNPTLEPCPEPPEELKDVLLPEWENYRKDEIGFRPEIDPFDEEDFRCEYGDWFFDRDEWREKQLKLAKAKALYTRFFNLRLKLEINSDEIELVIADGIFKDQKCETNDVYGDEKKSKIFHPLLLRRVKIDFDAEENTIRVIDSGTNSTFYEELFNEIGDDIMPGALIHANAEIREADYHPLGVSETVGFYKQFINSISSEGEYVDDILGGKYASRFLIGSEPMLILRRKPSGAARAISKIIENLQNGTDDVPEHLKMLLNKGIPQIPVSTDLSREAKLASVGGEAIDILLPKEANQEQLSIAQNIEKLDGVVVQGPPGTGKTHTIANLIGHFLAHGKTVLVTSHTSKALKVLKDKIVPELQGLCVSITDDSIKEVGKSVAVITSNNVMESTLEHRITEETAERSDVIARLMDVRRKLLSIREQECKNIVLNGESFSAISAAKFVAENKEVLENIIPGKVAEAEALPLSYDKLEQLYKSNAVVGVEDESQLTEGLPDKESIMSVEELADLVSIYDKNNEILSDIENSGYCHFYADDSDLTVVADGFELHLNYENCDNLEKLKEQLKQMHVFADWELKVAVAGMEGGIAKQSWLRLVDLIKISKDKYNAFVDADFGRNLNLADDKAVEEFEEQYKKLKETGGKLSILDRIFNTKLKKAASLVTINGEPLKSAEDCELVLKSIELQKARNSCNLVWKQLFRGCNVKDFLQLSETGPEKLAVNYAGRINWIFNSFINEYNSILNEVNSLGIPVDWLSKTSAFEPMLHNLELILKFLQTKMPQILAGSVAFLEKEAAAEKLVQYSDYLRHGNFRKSVACRQLAEAVDGHDISAYEKGRGELLTLISKYSALAERRKTLGEIKKFAPEWAEAIAARKGIHGKETVPENIFAAWKWKQLKQMLDDFKNTSYEELQEQAEYLSREYHKVTASLVADMAWLHLKKRIYSTPGMQQALRAWSELVRKIGKGTGRYAEKYKREAQKKMEACQEAVPVWIMPTAKALESFDPKHKFDIVIFDEASQSDVTALAVTFLGKKVIIVGDEEQVSPMAIGVKTDEIEQMRNNYISSWLPNSYLYSLKDSLYAIASTSFYSMMLVEHFRCVPEIIGFSNMLSYDYKIKPLREASSSKLLPAVVNYRVKDGQRDGKEKTNSREAKAIVSLLAACLTQPEYLGKTFGVISLLGSEQADLIQDMIVENIPNNEIEKRNIRCGSSAEFQGDERDVIFLSMVDSNEGKGVLRRMGEGPEGAYKKRYNVAASRAKDQLWVVNSLDEDNDLQPEDLRKRLLSYAKNPNAYKQRIDEIEKEADSPFEEAVAKTLIARGFRVKPQWRVGAYRIDMVVLYKNKRIAIECDGERFHSSPDKILEDMQRQTILERVGWRFIRIRGSEYYGDPATTMDRVIKLLNDKGIYPEEELVSERETRSSDLLEKVKSRALRFAQQLEKYGHIGPISVERPEVIKDPPPPYNIIGDPGPENEFGNTGNGSDEGAETEDHKKDDGSSGEDIDNIDDILKDLGKAEPQPEPEPETSWEDFVDPEPEPEPEDLSRNGADPRTEAGPENSWEVIGVSESTPVPKTELKPEDPCGDDDEPKSGPEPEEPKKYDDLEKPESVWKDPTGRFEILDNICILRENNDGGTREFNLVSWHHKSPKYDIRDWAPGYEDPYKGITLSEEEAYKLYEILKKEFD